jgi:hypothetical protein
MHQVYSYANIILNTGFESFHLCRLGGVVVSVLVTGPKGRGFEPGQGDGFVKGDKNP